MVQENCGDILPARACLGPIPGPEEVLPFSPRSQYLVGHLRAVTSLVEVPSRRHPTTTP